MSNKENNILKFKAMNFILLKNKQLDFDKLVEYLSIRGIEIDKNEIKDDIFTWNQNEISISVGLIKKKIPNNEPELNIKNSLFWKNKNQRELDYESHAIVFTTSNNAVQANMLCTLVTTAIISTNETEAIYNGNASMVIDPEIYREMSDVALIDEEKSLPILLWINIGFHEENEKTSCFSYGLYNLGYKEFEILDSIRTKEELYYFILNIIDYTLTNKVHFKEKETIGFSEEEKIKLEISKGKYVEENSIKIIY